MIVCLESSNRELNMKRGLANVVTRYHTQSISLVVGGDMVQAPITKKLSIIAQSE